MDLNALDFFSKDQYIFLFHTSSLLLLTLLVYITHVLVTSLGISNICFIGFQILALNDLAKKQYLIAYSLYAWKENKKCYI